MESPLAQAAVLAEVETEVVVTEAWDVKAVATFGAVAETEASAVTAEVISADAFTNTEASKAEATVLLGVWVDLATRSGSTLASGVGVALVANIASAVVGTVGGSSSLTVGHTTRGADAGRLSVSVDASSIAIAGLSAECSKALATVAAWAWPSLVMLKATEIGLTVRVFRNESITSIVVVVGTTSWITTVESLACCAADAGVWQHASLITNSSSLASAAVSAGVPAIVMAVSNSSRLVTSSRVMSRSSVRGTAFVGQANSSDKSSNGELHFVSKRFKFKLNQFEGLIYIS